MAIRFRWRVVASMASLLAGLGAAGAAAAASSGAPSSQPSGPLYGVTIDDISNISDVVASETAMHQRPTTRVYLDIKEPASYYVPALQTLHSHSYVMGELLDSSDMKSITPAQEHDRVASFLSTLGNSVDIWEVGNEVNGNWTGPYSTGASMITDAYRQVAGIGGHTALTLFYNQGCGDGPSELDPIAYSQQYLPTSVRQGLDYVLLSYYQTECNNQVLSAATVTGIAEQLHSLFPNAKVGFGEIGLPSPVSSSTLPADLQIVDHYYPLAVNLPYYVGGYFYWNYAEDGVPYTGNPVWSAISTAMDAESRALSGPGGGPTSTTSSSTTTSPGPTTTVDPASTTTSTAVAPTTTSPTTTPPTDPPTTVGAPSTTTPVTTPPSPPTSLAIPPTSIPAVPTGGGALPGVPTPPPTSPLTPFSGMATSQWPVNTAEGGWYEQWSGFGGAGTVYDPTRSTPVASLAPVAAQSPSETHSTLVTSEQTFTDPSFTVPIRTVRQLRQGSTPNDWEVAWVLWDYTPDDSFYSVILKPDGWELDKETKGVESFIAVGSSPGFAIGRWYDVSVSQTGSTLSVSVNGQSLVTATDNSYSSGSIGLYCEDSVAHYGDVAVSAR